MNDTPAVNGDEPAFGNGHAVGVARHVAQYLLGPAERLLGIDEPFGVTQWREIGIECFGVGEWRMSIEELQAASTVGNGELFQAQPSEQPREHLHWKKKVRPAGDPSVASRREPSTRDDHVHVGMGVER